MRDRHLVITGRVCIILIIRRGLQRRRGRRSKTSHASLLAGNAAYSSVHLTHLISGIVKTTTKVSLHLLKLLHDDLEGHTTSHGRGRSGRRWSRKRWNSRSCMIGCPHMWSLRLKLSLTSLDRTSADGTHNGEKRRERGMGMEKC